MVMVMSMVILVLIVMTRGDNDGGGVGGEGNKPQCLDLVRVALHQDFGLRKIRSH